MYSVNQWFTFTKGLDKNTCNKIRNLAKGKWEKPSINVKKGITDEERITGAKLIQGENKNVRISDIAWISDQWVYETVGSWMKGANELAGWKYDIRGAEGMQITRYKKGGFYGFHRDGKSDHLSAYDEPNNKFIHGYVRKLSMSVLLNDNYEGGEFQFGETNQKTRKIETTELNKTGSIIVFPSDMEHRVTPVTKGIRYSLVVWFLGPPFR